MKIRQVDGFKRQFGGGVAITRMTWMWMGVTSVPENMLLDSVY